MRAEEKQKLVVVGLDGTPHSLITELVDRGELPNIAQLFRTGSVCRMHSSRPEVSSVAWSCFMTGQNPGKHGIYGFVDRVPGSYDITVLNSASMRSLTLWEVLSRRGCRVLVMNVPVTYPPRPVNGILVSGFLSPTLQKATYPAEVASRLEALGYVIDVDPWRAREALENLVPDLEVALDRRFGAFLELWQEISPDFAILQVMETDRLQHFLWEHYERRDEEYAPRFLEFYQRIDAAVGNLVQELGEGVRYILLSDHGFCTLEKEVYVNHWLVEAGWLKFKKHPAESLADIDESSRAYALDPARIYLHLRGREPRGSVEPGPEAERVRKELVEALSDMKDPETAEPLLNVVLRGEEIYHGPALDGAPDLLLMPRRGFDLKGSVKKGVLMDKGPLVGMHTFDDAFIFIQGHEISKEVAEITDAMPTVLDLMGVPVPEDLDGVSLLDGRR